MPIFTEITIPRWSQGGMNADATGPFGQQAMEPHPLLDAQPQQSDSLADRLLVRLAGQYRASPQEGLEGARGPRFDGADMFAARNDLAGTQTPGIARAFGDDLPQDDLDRRAATITAVKPVMDRRRTDAGRYVAQLSPEIFAGWNTAFATDPSDPKAYDQINYDKTLALSVAIQKSLGIEDEHLQPIPFFILLKLADDRDSGNMYQMENYARWSEVFARTKDPVARAALGRELDAAGLGGILPSGRPGLSAGEVFQSEGKGLGKAVANAAVAPAD